MFSTIAGLLGLAVICWYGLADMGASEKAAEERRMAEERAEPHIATITDNAS